MLIIVTPKHYHYLTPSPQYLNFTSAKASPVHSPLRAMNCRQHSPGVHNRPCAPELEPLITLRLIPQDGHNPRKLSGDSGRLIGRYSCGEDGSGDAALGASGWLRSGRGLWVLVLYTWGSGRQLRRGSLRGGRRLGVLVLCSAVAYLAAEMVLFLASDAGHWASLANSIDNG